jgi:histidinol-phosphate aminotransferase
MTETRLNGLLHRVRDEIRALGAYHVQDARGLLKLDAMENPYPLPAPVQERWCQTLSGVEVNRYPAPDAPALMQALRQAMGIDPADQLLLGNGSDELIQIILMALARPGASVLAVEPCFVMYRMIARFVGMDYVGVPLTADFQIDLEETLAAIATCQPAVIFLAEPNNPTGNHYDPDAVRQIIEAAPGLVVLDEAYLPFSDRHALHLLRQYPQVVVLRTLSKLGLAGLRLGLLVGHPALLAELDKVRLPYNINGLTQAAATLCLEHLGEFETQAAQIRAERERLYAPLRALGLQPFPSSANFILLRTPAGQARRIFEGLKAQGILIKCTDGSHPLLADTLRLTVGRPEDNQQVLAALRTLV